MRSMKKATYVCAITLVIAGLVITSAAAYAPLSTMSTPTGSKNLTVVKSNEKPQRLSMNAMQIENFEIIPRTLDANPAFEGAGDQVHPAFGRTMTGTHMAAYRDGDMEQIIWTFSTDDGNTYDPGVYYDVGGDYPSIKLWDESRFFGTFVTDPQDLNGGPTYLFECTDPADTETYSLVYWDWSSYGWHDMIDADIACDNSQNEWEWGVSTYVTSTTYGQGYTNGPTVIYADENTPDQGWISWYYVDGCAHTDIDIDTVTHMVYAVYDNEYAPDSWKLLVRVMDFVEIQNGYDELFEIIGAGDLQCPAVAANNDTLVIVAETNENGNKDIICLYSDNGINNGNLDTSFVASTDSDEMYPDVRYVGDETFICTFVKDGKLYKSVSEDGGATWSTEEEVYDNVVEEYKTSDLTEGAVKAMWEVDNGEDIDIYIGDIVAPPEQPILQIESIKGGFGVTATIKNIGTANATNVEWSIGFSGGLVIPKEKTGTIPTIAPGDEATIKAFVIGFGKTTITVQAQCDEGAETTSTASGFVFTILVLGVK